MSDLTVTPPADLDELKRFVPAHRRTYLMSPEDGEAWAEWVPVGNVRILRRGDAMIGGATLVPMGQWFGGRPIQMTGISAVGVEPAERATGAGTFFMREILTELHATGVPISTLYPATQTVYRRCGYELAGDFIRYKLATDHVDVRDRSLTIELTEDREYIKPIYDERSRRTAGVLDRTDHMWTRIFEPYKREVAQTYVVDGANGPEGYISYTREPGSRTPAQKMYADIAVLTPGAARRILTFIADHRSFIESVHWTGSPADPFPFLLSEPRRDVERSWPWMLRIVDVERALTERGYSRAVEADLDLELTDDVLPVNNGAYRLNVSGGKASVERGGKAWLKLDVRGLAPLYSGYMGAEELKATGYIDGPDEDIAAATAIFAGPAPWLADFF